jgi:hypothetical protein
MFSLPVQGTAKLIQETDKPSLYEKRHLAPDRHFGDSGRRSTSDGACRRHKRGRRCRPDTWIVQAQPNAN